MTFHLLQLLCPDEDPSVWTAGEWISTSRFRIDAKHLCLDVGHHDIVDGL